MRLHSFALSAAALIAASPALAEPRPVVDPPASRAAARDGVTVYVFNDADSDAPFAPPDRLEARAQDGAPITLVPDVAGTTAIRAHAFAKLRYRLADDSAVAATLPTPPAAVVSAAPTSTADVKPGEQTTISSRGSSSAFLDRLYAYEPIYGVWGPGSSGAKLQFSFAARPIGGTGALSHLRFAYTQQIFWDVNAVSGPVRSSTYSPELFVELPLTPRLQLATGYRHDSNGGTVANSVDLNRVYVKLSRSFDLGNGWQANLTPQLWYNFGNHGIAPNIDDYWGNGAINASIEQRDGIKLSVFARGNPATGKGGSEFFLSYPIKRFGVGDVGIYLFGQAYTGYGEQLIDYNRNETHARIGISFTR